MLTSTALGVTVGLILALTGAGGGILAVPLLMFALSWDITQAAPVALLAVGASAALGALIGLRQRAVRYRAAGLIALVGGLLTPLGVFVAHAVPAEPLTLAFAAVLLSLAFRSDRQATSRPTDSGTMDSPAACAINPESGRFAWNAACARALLATGALITGIAFGFLLQKGRVAKLDVIVGQLTLRDWTVVKIMATAVAVGSVGVYALVSLGLAELHIKPALLGGVIVGGLLFGAGLAVFGYCPGTGVAASGEGHRDAMVGVAGMLAGAAAYVALYPALQPLIKSLADWGKITLPDAASTSHWPWVAGLVAVVALGLSALSRRPAPPAGAWRASGSGSTIR